MKTFWIVMVVVIAAALGWFARTGFTEDEPAPPAKPDAPEDPMMAEMIKLGTPGPQHKHLEPLAGIVGRGFVHVDGAGRADDVQGHVQEHVGPGRPLLRQEYQGDMDGLPFHGLGYTGFDNYKKQFVGTWMDSWSSNYMPVSGPPSADGKTITTSGEWDGPMGKFTFRYVIEIKSKDEHVMTMYMSQDGGEEMKHMELIYRRKAE